MYILILIVLLSYLGHQPTNPVSLPVQLNGKFEWSLVTERRAQDFLLSCLHTQKHLKETWQKQLL